MGNRDKTIFISGASSGIGRECALRIAENGFRVLAGVRSEKASKRLKNEAPENLKTVFLDVTDDETINSLKRIVCSENLYGIVNNAGTAVLGPFEFIPIKEIRRQFEVNLFGHIAITQALLPHLRRSGEGRIINMSSISSQIAFPYYGPYAASKFALEAFGDALRRELRPWNIKVVSVRPGNMSTPIWFKSFSKSQSISNTFPSEATTYYKEMFFKSDSGKTKLGKPSTVAEIVLKALTVKKPKAHYLVGRDARKFAMFKWISPDWLIDRVLS